MTGRRPLRSLPHDYPVARSRRRTARTWLTVEEVAAELRVSKMTVTRLVNRGKIRALRVGRSIRIDEAAFDRWAYGVETVIEDET
jgi:excisionase family DNA binding protein